MSNPYKTREGGATVTVFVPYDCNNHCPFCINKKEYADCSGFSLDAILRSIHTMDGVNYNVYFADYYQPVAANETTEQLICGVYLDKNVDMKDGKYIDTRYPNADLSILEGTVKYPVFAVAVQADGFDTAAAAMDAAFGANYNPWGGDATNWQ